MGIFDAFKTKKQTKVERGKEVEDDFKARRELLGDTVERTGIGSDHRVSWRDPISGRKHSEPWEHKRNNSRLSKRQRDQWGLKVNRQFDPSPERPFGETVTENRFGQRLERNMFTGKWERVPKRRRDPLGIDSMLGMDSPRQHRTKQNHDPFDVGNMLGFGSSGSRKRRRRNVDPFGLLS